MRKVSMHLLGRLAEAVAGLGVLICFGGGDSPGQSVTCRFVLFLLGSFSHNRFSADLSPHNVWGKT